MCPSVLFKLFKNNNGTLSGKYVSNGTYHTEKKPFVVSFCSTCFAQIPLGCFCDRGDKMISFKTLSFSAKYPEFGRLTGSWNFAIYFVWPSPHAQSILFTTCLLFLLSIFTSCQKSQSLDPIDNLFKEIRYGTSPSHFDRTQIIIKARKTTWIVTSNTNRSTSRIGYLPEEERYLLLQSFDWEVVNSLPDTVGCPDCWQNGAEWIEVILADSHKKLTFEKGALIEGIEGLQAILRLIYSTFYNRNW